MRPQRIFITSLRVDYLNSIFKVFQYQLVTGVTQNLKFNVIANSNACREVYSSWWYYGPNPLRQQLI